MDFKTVKSNFDKGLWNKKMVRQAVGRIITKEEYAKITGETY